MEDEAGVVFPSKEPGPLSTAGEGPVCVNMALEFSPRVKMLMLEREPVGAIHQVASQLEDMNPGELMQVDLITEAFDSAFYLLPDCIQRTPLAICSNGLAW